MSTSDRLRPHTAAPSGVVAPVLELCESAADGGSVQAVRDALVRVAAETCPLRPALVGVADDAGVLVLAASDPGVGERLALTGEIPRAGNGPEPPPALLRTPDGRRVALCASEAEDGRVVLVGGETISE